MIFWFFFFKQKTAYEMRISDWSSDVCSSDLHGTDAGGIDRGVERGGVAQILAMIAAIERRAVRPATAAGDALIVLGALLDDEIGAVGDQLCIEPHDRVARRDLFGGEKALLQFGDSERHHAAQGFEVGDRGAAVGRSDEHTSELPSLL